MAEGAESLDLNGFHTVRTINPDPGGEQFARDRAIVVTHVGRYVIDWAHLDYTLNLVAALWNGTLKTDRQSKKMARLKFQDKIKILKEQFDPGWRGGQTLLEILLAANRYRNDIAHWSFGYSGMAEGEQLG